MATAKAIKTFKELNDKLPYSPQTPNGRGFLPPFLRAVGHLLYGLGRVTDSKEKDKFDFLKVEIKDAVEHFSSLEVNSAFSVKAKENLVGLTEALEAYQREYEGWAEEERLSNMRNLVNKALGIASALDRELIGIRNSDPGSAL